MLKTKPIVKEAEDAVEFNYKQGGIKIQNLSFKHYVLDDTQGVKKENQKKEDGKEAEDP